MAKNYQQLIKQINVLTREAEVIKKKEVAGVVSKIKVAIEFYGLTEAELFGKSAAAPKAAAAPKPKASAAGDSTARFTDGTGNTWVGRGPRPQWLRDAIASGKSLKDFAVDGGAAPAAPAPAPKAAAAPASSSTPTAGKTPGKKYLSAVKYRDDAGHEWSGRGPKPTWVKDALTAGKSLQDLAA